jgi:dihydroorotase
VWPDRLDRLGDLWREGAVYFKAFTCETHGVPAIEGENLVKLARTVAELGAPCLVHSEDDAITAANEEALRAAGRHDGGIVPVWRSPEAERVSTAEVAAVARETRARLLVAHVSNADLLELLAREREGGSKILAECCPQYLSLWEREVLELGAFRKFTPPARIRSAADEQRMWDAFNAGLIHHLSSDHAPSTAAQTRDGDIWDVHFGLPGIDTTMPLMLDAALRGRTSLERLAEAYALRPARVYGLAGKGSLNPGDDADLILIDPEQSWEVRDEDIRSLAGWSPYSGRNLRGRVVATYLRGAEIARDRAVRGERRGAWLAGQGA